MARTAMTFTVSGDKELRQKLQEYGRRGITAAMRGLKVTMIDILADAKNRLLKNRSIATGKLFSKEGSKIQLSPDDKYAYELSFGGGDADGGDYAAYLEFGRRAGKGLNDEGIEAMVQWYKKKGIKPEVTNERTGKTKTLGKGAKYYELSLRGMAIAYSGRLKKRGRKGKPFLFPAFEAKKGNLIANIEKELEKLNKEMTK